MMKKNNLCFGDIQRNLLEQSHLKRDLRSEFSCLLMVLRLWLEFKRPVSSANKYVAQ